MQTLRLTVYLSTGSADLTSVAQGVSDLAAGLEHHRAGRLQQAEQIYRRVLLEQPDHADALHLLGLIASQSGQPDTAIRCIQDALRRNPAEPIYHNNLGKIFQAQGRIADAAECFRSVLRLRPDDADAYVNLGNNHCRLGSNADAMECYRQALERRPDHPEACANLGELLREQGRLEDGLAYLRKALRHKGPIYDRAAVFAASALFEQGWIEEAIAGFRDALGERCAPAVHSSLLSCLNYSAVLEPEEVFREHCRWGEQHSAASVSHNNDPSPERPLRIGYVSPDFHTHPVALFLEPILGGHHRPEFRCVCYSNTVKSDSTTDRLRALADEWREICGSTDQTIAQQIRKDKIDILVDLAGHTSHNRLPVFAQKPAPVQVTYLGYPNTTGLAAIDYRITDIWADPADRLHTETLVRLPSGFLCYRPPEDAPPIAERDGPFMFGSFNNISKVTTEVMATWAAILRAVPGSRLRLKAKMLGDPGVRRRVREGFHSSGISAGRVELLDPVADFRLHLEAYHSIDMALDTFPYNGTTTTCEALWMGVPVLTLIGHNHASRVGWSILSRIGLAELAAESRQAYVETAIRLSQSPEHLRRMRAGMRGRMQASSLLDAARLTREMEDAYRAMWRRWCAEHEERA